jgi:hypothetical protein
LTVQNRKTDNFVYSLNFSRESKFSPSDTLKSVPNTVTSVSDAVNSTSTIVNESNFTEISAFEFLKLSLLFRHQNSLQCPNFSTASIKPVLVPEAVAIDFNDFCFSSK